jgi:hypothetical protein
MSNFEKSDKYFDFFGGVGARNLGVEKVIHTTL